MKKYSIPICVMILIISMCFCAFSQTPATYQPVREGIWPYEFTEKDKSILRDFGLSVGSNAMMYQFHAPEEAVEMLVRVYQVENNRWQKRDKFGISIGEEREPVDRLSGTLSIHRSSKHEMIFRIHCAGLAEIPVTLQEIENIEALSMSYSYLQTGCQIQMGKEIPLLLYHVNADNTIKSYAIDALLEEIPKTIELDNTLDILVTVTFNETDEKILENYKVIE